MARARNIKPGFFTDAELVECTFWVRLLFAGLWTLADRDGRLLDRVKQIGLDLFPRDAVDVDAGLNELVAHGFIIRYEIDGQHIIQVKNFKNHQNPHRDERASTLPCLPFKGEHSASTVQAPCESGANRADSGFPVTDSLSLGIEESHDSSLAGSRQPYPDDFETFWKSYGPTNGPKKPAYTAWKSLSKAHRAAALAALPAWLGSVKWQTGFKDYPQKYLNQRFWEADPAAGSQGASPTNGRVVDLEELARIDRRLRELQEAP